MAKNKQSSPTESPRPHVLLVDDDPDLLNLVARWLQLGNMDVTTTNSGMKALAFLKVQRPSIVISDLVMDGMDGLKLLSEIHRHDPVLPVILLSGKAQADDGLKAAHLGVAAFLTKPSTRDEVLETVNQALADAGQRRSTNADQDNFGDHIVHQSRLMVMLMDRARLVAKADSSVLITGSTGTGKELLAHAIHTNSARRENPFVAINCSALPDQLLESELFGHEKGAFTGAATRHIGLFQAADGGTLFLDEIGDMPPAVQAKLLRVLQDFQIRPVGSTKSIPVDVRIVAATHHNLPNLIANGEFREDLFYRLNVVPLHIPALDERREDIGLIVEHLLTVLAHKQGRAPKQLAPGVREYLSGASWPGNIRQLANVLERAWVLSTTDTIPLDLVQSSVSNQPGEIMPLDEAKRGFEKRYLVGLLHVSEGNVANAARLAGRNRTEFYKLLTKHTLDATDFRKRG